jgi:hypothetical protein
LETDGLERELLLRGRIGIANLSGVDCWSLFTCSIEIRANRDTAYILRWYDWYLMARLLKIAHFCE